MLETRYLLNMDNISKEYYGNKVLKNVGLQVKPGEIHALMGKINADEYFIWYASNTYKRRI